MIQPGERKDKRFTTEDTENAENGGMKVGSPHVF